MNSIHGPQVTSPCELFQSFWHGRELSPLAWACFSSFSEADQSLKLFSYKPLLTPQDVELEDARSIIPKDRIFKVLDSYSPFSNLFRFKLLNERGGWWVDADVLCLRKPERIEGPAIFGWEDASRVNCGQLKLQKGHPIARRALNVLENLDFKTIEWGESGPQLLTKIVLELQLEKFVLPRHVFYPLHWSETFKLWLKEFKEEVDECIKNSDYLHCWGSVFRQIGINIHRHKPEAGSFLDEIYQKSEIYETFDLVKKSRGEIISSVNDYLGQCWIKDYRKPPFNIPLPQKI